MKSIKSDDLKAILFDMDGTLVDTESTYVEAVHLCLKKYHITIDHQKLLKIVYGRSRKMISNDLCKQFTQLNQLEFEKEIDVNFEELIQNNDITIESSCDALRKLRKNYHVAIVSGSTRHHIETFTRIANVHLNYQFYLGSEDYANGKPDPECYLLAAEKLNLKPEQCLVIEDSNVGVRAAKAAGMQCIALKRPSAPNQDLSLADCIIDSLEKLDL